MILGVLLTISFIGYLCAQNMVSSGFISSEATIQRLPPVEVEGACPPAGEPFVIYSLDAAPSLVAPAPAPPTPAFDLVRVPPIPEEEKTENQATASETDPATPSEVAENLPTPTAEEKPKEEKAKEEEKKEEPKEEAPDEWNRPGYSTGPLGLITVPEKYAWVNEVRPASMLIRTTRFLSQYVENWDGSVQLGADGTSGSSETFNITFGVNAKRQFEVGSFKFDIDYKRNNSDSVITANRLFFDCKYEYPYSDGRWTLFAQDEVTYDEFQPWDLQVAISAGVGYYLWKTETTKLQTLWGGGFSQDIGGPDDEYVPEMHFGVNGEHQINKRQKFIASCDYYPDVTDFTESRMVSKASWEVLLDEEVNLSMKFNVNQRIYCPNPGGNQNEVDYSVLLMWKF